MTTNAAATDLLIKFPAEISAGWLEAVLGESDLAIVGVSRIGTGQMSQSHRVSFTVAGASASVVVKLSSDDETSRATGVGMGAYYREIAFYKNLAPLVGGSLPACHLAVYDDAEGWFTLVLEDIADATQGDQIAGCTPEQAELALRELARLHAPVLNDLALGTREYLNLENPINQGLMTMLLPGFLDRYADRIKPEYAEVCRVFVASSDAWLADRRPPLGLVHGDFRLDNLLFTDDGCTVVDWQTMTWGPAMLDASYFIGGGLSVADRREHEERLVRIYHDGLLAAGVQNFSWETCWTEYRRQTFLSLLMTFVPAMVVVRTDRGDDMFMAVFDRVCQQILDLDSLSLLPEPGAKPVPLVPAAVDEGPHAPGVEPLWNESWYFDAVSPSGDLGLYVRQGRLPHQDACVYTTAIVRPGKPTVMVVDHAAPLPAADDPDSTVSTSTISATQHCDEPLHRFSVGLSATGESYDDPAAVLRGEAGVPVPVSLSLVWETDGAPYAWRASTRYEIPCRVTGTVEIDGEVIAFDGPGQRDHSWGSRDWWANDWMWSAFALDDGTRTHAVTAPEIPGFAVGYQQLDGVVTELEGGTTTQELGADGLVTAARISTEPGQTVLDVEPLGFG
ncbi:MAG: hypothetical protein JWP74_784, partial [Marmoricola sp.]|nr:hypothetical protein [Marmoricola sp.]